MIHLDMEWKGAQCDVLYTAIQSSTIAQKYFGAIVLAYSNLRINTIYP